MSRIRSDQPILPSVLDRLLDDQPDVSTEPVASQTQVLRQVHRSVRRDLENLLNTRIRSRSWPKELTELNRSVVGYGVPDISAADLAQSMERRAFLRTIESVIRTYEPRFKTVRVTILQNADMTERLVIYNPIGVNDGRFSRRAPDVYEGYKQALTNTTFSSVKGYSTPRRGY